MYPKAGTMAAFIGNTEETSPLLERSAFVSIPLKSVFEFTPAEVVV